MLVCISCFQNSGNWWSNNKFNRVTEWRLLAHHAKQKNANSFYQTKMNGHLIRIRTVISATCQICCIPLLVAELTMNYAIICKYSATSTRTFRRGCLVYVSRVQVYFQTPSKVRAKTFLQIWLTGKTERDHHYPGNTQSHNDSCRDPLRRVWMLCFIFQLYFSNRGWICWDTGKPLSSRRCY